MEWMRLMLTEQEVSLLVVVGILTFDIVKVGRATATAELRILLGCTGSKRTA